jgi:hypothetical protein
MRLYAQFMAHVTCFPETVRQSSRKVKIFVKPPIRRKSHTARSFAMALVSALPEQSSRVVSFD